MFMFSMPPATMTSCSPARMELAASMTDFSPEPHTLLTLSEPISGLRPAFMAAWRVGFWPTPAESTMPIMHSWMSFDSSPALLTLSFITAEPKSGEGTSFNVPPNFPMAVRQALNMTASFVIADSLSLAASKQVSI
jgi:hypothetical protein